MKHKYSVTITKEVASTGDLGYLLLCEGVLNFLGKQVAIVLKLKNIDMKLKMIIPFFFFRDVLSRWLANRIFT